MDVQVNVVYQCDKCPEKFHNLEKFSAHLDFHELQKQAHEGGEYENLNVAQRRIVVINDGDVAVINDGNGAQSQEDNDIKSLANQFALREQKQQQQEEWAKDIEIQMINTQEEDR